MAWIMDFLMSGTKGVPASVAHLPDHDLANNFVTATSSKWKASTRCPKCKNAVNYEEQRTNICLSCGQQSDLLTFRTGATRKVVRDGSWVEHLRFSLSDYLYLDGKWKRQ